MIYHKTDADRSGIVDESELGKLLIDMDMQSVDPTVLARHGTNLTYDFDQFVQLYNELLALSGNQTGILVHKMDL